MQTSEIILHGIANHPFVPHAATRMQQRGIKPEHIELVLRYGRTIYSRGLIFRVVGRKEVERYSRDGLDLDAVEGIHVLVQPDGTVVTTYRNHDLRPIRPKKRKHAMHH